MRKSIELTKSQIKALKDGATMFIFGISDYDLNRINKGYSIGDSFPINKGDKDILIKPLICKCNSGINNSTGNCIKCNTFIDYSIIDYNKYFYECIDVKIIRPKNMTRGEADIILQYGIVNLTHKDWYNNLMKEQNINRTYEDNDYIFLIEFKTKEN